MTSSSACMVIDLQCVWYIPEGIRGREWRGQLAYDEEVCYNSVLALDSSVVQGLGGGYLREEKKRVRTGWNLVVGMTRRVVVLSN